jgi:MraZ protein
MFLGSFKTYFSGKNRLILPKKFRKELGQEDNFFILLGENGEIWGFDPINWQKQAENVLETPLFTEEGRLRRLKFFSKADECILDNQGRFILPQEFVDWAKLRKDILIVGAGDHFEIWNPQLMLKQKINEPQNSSKN